MVAAIVIAAGIWWAVGTPAQAEDPALGPPITVTRIGPLGTESPSPDDNNPLTPIPETPDTPDMLDIGALEVPPAPPPIAGNDDDDIDDNADADDVDEVDDLDSDEVFDNHDDGGEKTDGD